MTVKWDELPHAHGTATNIPPLLLAARTAPAPVSYKDEPWYSLWSALCHQGDVYWASYAALPELIDVAAVRRDAGRGEAILLAASIELARHSEFAPEMPSQLREAYERALGRARDLLSSWTKPAWEVEAQQWAVAAAVFAGRFEEARALLGEDQ
ncbi:MAG: hypothetical protein ACYC0B_11695 [Gemmatimonadaceae bacterium]